MKHLNTYTKEDIYILKDLLSSLVQHMIEKGLSIKPYPKIIFVNRNFQNAHNFFGRTASYNPKTRKITIYTLGRHPKDILRSFSHEMIHHEQNVTGKTKSYIKNNKNTNINIDKHLAEMEEEAYDKGNMLFRSWTDSLKDKVTYEV